MVGHTNANDVVILGGLSERDQVYLSVPAGLQDDEITLLKEMNGKRRKDKEEEKPAESESPKVMPTASHP
jgi:hypothetical protein